MAIQPSGPRETYPAFCSAIRIGSMLGAMVRIGRMASVLSNANFPSVIVSPHGLDCRASVPEGRPKRKKPTPALALKPYPARTLRSKPWPLLAGRPRKGSPFGRQRSKPPILEHPLLGGKGETRQWPRRAPRRAGWRSRSPRSRVQPSRRTKMPTPTPANTHSDQVAVWCEETVASAHG